MTNLLCQTVFMGERCEHPTAWDVEGSMLCDLCVRGYCFSIAKTQNRGAGIRELSAKERMPSPHTRPHTGSYK